MASQVGMDNGQLMPRCELQNKGVSAGKYVGVLFSCQDIFLLILSLENLACFLSWENPLQTRPAAAHAGETFVCVAALVYSDPSVHFLHGNSGNHVFLLFPTLQLRKVRHRQVTGFAQDHTACM